MIASLGKYELVRILGKGAMGVVYEGFDPVISRRVAIKTVDMPSADDLEAQEEFARFKREAQAAGRLHHPCITAVFDYGETPEKAYIVMEFIDGTTLRQVLDSGRRFTIPEILGLMEDLLAALQFSHEHGVVHRDIKPANIMMDKNGGLKIADFGIARLDSSGMTQAGMMIGTPTYMSPEQFLAQNVDARSDLYSSGVVLYQLLTGEKPFDGGLTALMHKVLYSDPPPPSVLDVTVPPAFDVVVQCAMAKRPDDRYATAAAFAVALRNAYEGRQVPQVAAPEAPPPGAGPRVPRNVSGLADATLLARPVESEAWAKLQRNAAIKDVNTAPEPPQAPPAQKAPSPKGTAPIGVVGVGAIVLALVVGGGVWLLRTPPAPPAPAPVPVLTAAQIQSSLTNVLGALPCTLLSGDVSGAKPVITGFAGSGAPQSALASALASLPAGMSPVNQVTPMNGPYCTVLDTIRPYQSLFHSAGATLGIGLAGGKAALVDGDLITLNLKMPSYAGYLQTDYFSSDGTVFHLYPTKTDAQQHLNAGDAKTLGDPSTGGASWQVSAPFGADMVVAVYSSTPLFTALRPQDETASDYLSALRQALQNAADSGESVTVAALPVVTGPK